MPPKHNNHPAQLTYRAAVVCFDVVDEEIEAIGDEVSERAANVEADWDAAANTLQAAEDALINWSWEVVKGLPGAAGARVAVDAALAGRVVARIKVLDIATRLAA
jgi:hypothetical protein